LAGSCVAVEQQWRIELDRLPEELRQYLKHSREAEFNVLIDLPEEECYLESFKTVSRRDQRHLIAKMQGKRFENALLSKADVTGSRKSMSLLLAGIVKHKICADLIRLLDQLEISVRAVHSPLTLTGALTKHYHSGKGACLFVISLHGCFRLIACINSFVFFNRRIEFEHKEKNELLKVSLTETLVYLQRQQVEGWVAPLLIMPDAALTASCETDVLKPLMESGLVSEIRECQREPVVDSAQPLEQKQASKKNLAHSESPVDKRSAEMLLATAACRCGNGYASRKHRSAYHARKVRNICAALALCGIGGAVSSAAVARKLNGQHEVLMATYSQSADGLQKTVAEHDSAIELISDYVGDNVHEYSVEAVRQAMVTAELIELGMQNTPVDFLSELAENVHGTSGVSVSSVQWEVEDLLIDTSLAEVLTQPAAINTLDLEHVYRATVSGVVQGNPDAALTTFESFVSTLRRANGDPTVVVVETPFGLGDKDKTTTSSLSAATGAFLLELSATKVER